MQLILFFILMAIFYFLIKWWQRFSRQRSVQIEGVWCTLDPIGDKVVSISLSLGEEEVTILKRFQEMAFAHQYLRNFSEKDLYHIVIHDMILKKQNAEFVKHFLPALCGPIAIVGGQGMGKTVLANAIATNSGKNIMHVEGDWRSIIHTLNDSYVLIVDGYAGLEAELKQLAVSENGPALIVCSNRELFKGARKFKVIEL